ncbi:phosphomannomutase/phosphoglucomutase [Patulibacter minatonensis]|uniref:phosphomannomutase/phosphoglucomutase n=1 Tax=Patulibacter minatonensis TaxID=298163 RepID=UPI00047A630C|nr:phosphomannomutase/phosphoglucomutase [Patulibacter minatonensis]
MSVPPEIFKAYDVRGIAGEQIDAAAAHRIGRAFARVISDLSGKPTTDLTLAVGRDMRLSAPELLRAYRDGIVLEGASVVDLGQVGSEMLYWTVGTRGLDGGLMCTASHNPKAYTGAKLVEKGALALSGERGINEIKELAIGTALDEEPQGVTPGTVVEEDVYAAFQEASLEFIDASSIKPLKVVVDGGNGMAGPMVGPVLDRLGLDLVETYWTPDGNFPDHEPNPLLPENRQFIIDKVLETGADLGIAWDGDADRCFFIDDLGRFIDGDFLTALLAESLLEKQPGATILYDCRASRVVADVVQSAGGTALINRVGHAFFKTRMPKEGAIFGGEVSGHYYFEKFSNADSGTIPALLILELLSVRGQKLSELVGRFHEQYFISGEINSTVDDADAKMTLIEEEHRAAGATITHVDGVSVDYEDWHFNVRKSNTEPLLRLCLESLVSPQDMEEKRDAVLGVIRS